MTIPKYEFPPPCTITATGDGLLRIIGTIETAPLATWDATSGKVTLNWPAIEQVADGDTRAIMRGFACILLAARDAGRPQGFV